MLADPGLVIVQPVEVNQKLHVAIESEQRVFVQRMKGSEKNSCLQKPVVHRPDLLCGFQPADFDRSDNWFRGATKGLSLRIASSSPKQHDALRINTDEYFLPSRQWVKRRAASDKLLTAPKEMHLGEVALKDRLVDARGPDVTLADGPQRRNLQVNRTY